MTNAQLLITARLAHQEAARIFAEVAHIRDANGAAHKAAADRLEQAGFDLAVVVMALNSASSIYLSDPDTRARLEAWRPADDEDWSDPEPPAVAVEGEQP